MALGSCIIDGTDLHTLGIFIERGGSDDFLSFPDRRTPDTNDWAEYDGLEVDLQDCSFDAKKVRVNYVITADNETDFKQRLNNFETLHFAPGYREVYIKEFDKTFTLRFVGFTDYKHRGGLLKSGKKIGKMAVDYMMDDPLQLFPDVGETPASTRPNLAQLQINQIDLSQFGIVVRDVYSTALRPSSAKSVQVRKMESVSGVTADVGVAPKKQSRQIVIECTMLAETVQEFWTNWTALLNNMRVTVPVKLGVTRTGRVLDCYYSKMTNFKKEAPFSRKIRASFHLVLQEIGDTDAAYLIVSPASILWVYPDYADVITVESNTNWTIN